MKTSALFLGFALMLPMAAGAQDDVYYIPSKDIRKVTTTDGEIVPTQDTADKAKYYEENRDVDDYNRRGSAVASTDDSDYDEQPATSVESRFDDNSDSDVSYPCTKLVMRFHSPHVGYIVSSPYYWDVCYSDVWDVYYDGWAAYVPSYTYWSYAYDPWYYHRWHFRSCWDFTWGWYDPWYSRAYWGWGRPIYWGWNRPVFHPRHIGRPMWGHRGFDRGYAPGFGHHGGRTFAGRGFDRPRGDFGGRGASFGGRAGSGRPLSGVFRADRRPLASHNNGQMSRGSRHTGPNSVERAGVMSRGGGGVTRGGFDRNDRHSGINRVENRNNRPNGGSIGSGRSSIPSSVGRSGNNSRPSGGTIGSGNSSRPSGGGGIGSGSSRPSGGGGIGSGSSRPSGGGGIGSGSSRPSGGGGIGRSSSPSHGGGGGVSRGGGGVSRGGRR